MAPFRQQRKSSCKTGAIGKTGSLRCQPCPAILQFLKKIRNCRHILHLKEFPEVVNAVAIQSAIETGSGVFQSCQDFAGGIISFCQFIEKASGEGFRDVVYLLINCCISEQINNVPEMFLFIAITTKEQITSLICLRFMLNTPILFDTRFVNLNFCVLR